MAAREEAVAVTDQASEEEKEVPGEAALPEVLQLEMNESNEQTILLTVQ